MKFLPAIGLILLYLCISGLVQASADKENSTLGMAVAKGQNTYMRFCSVCHGTDGKSEDTGLHHLKTLPPDLTYIAARNGGEFPWIRVFNTIYGKNKMTAHDSRQMPEWGELFDLRNWSDQGNNYAEEIVQGRIFQLMLFLNSIQVSEDTDNE